jgi:hypothetical protein
MKKLLYSRPVGVLFAVVITIVSARFSVFAAEKREARVTEVIKDVRLLASQTAPRPASVNDSVREGTVVRTGSDSRAELTFTDESLTRLGANTLFSFSTGGRNVDLANGALLLAVPKGASTTKVKAGAATVAITGFTMLAEHHPKSASKIIILEGHGVVSLKGVRTPPCDMHAGQMMIIPPRPVTCPEVYNVRITKILKTARLITQFRKLPKWSLDAIWDAAKHQEAFPPAGGYRDSTGIDTIDQTTIARPPPSTIIRPEPPS